MTELCIVNLRGTSSLNQLGYLYGKIISGSITSGLNIRGYCYTRSDRSGGVQATLNNTTEQQIGYSQGSGPIYLYFSYYNRLVGHITGYTTSSIQIFDALGTQRYNITVTSDFNTNVTIYDVPADITLPTLTFQNGKNMQSVNIGGSNYTSFPVSRTLSSNTTITMYGKDKLYLPK